MCAARDGIVADPLLAPYFLDIRKAWIDAFNPGVPQDVTDKALDVPPSSLCQDTIHPNAAGIAVWERAIEIFHGPVLDDDRTFIHRDFYPDQVLVDGARVYLLDLDLYSLGEPPLDVAPEVMKRPGNG